MEEKVFSRSVNKSGLAARVVDSRFPERNFSAEELTNLLEIENWVQCELCDKWRMLPPVSPSKLEKTYVSKLSTII